MGNPGVAVHRTIVAVDIEGFGDRCRTNRNQVAVRDGLYRAMREAFGQTGISWADHHHEDRGDGIFILAGPEVPKSVFAESLPSALVSALCLHNGTHPDLERIRMRMALHAGEVHLDEHGATSASINLAFRLLECGPVKEALAASHGVLAVIASSWFFEEVVRHSAAGAAAYRPVTVAVKETTTTGWICLPDHLDLPGTGMALALKATGGPAAELSGQRTPAAGDVAVPRQLPACTAHFTGRSAELAALTGLLDRAAAVPAGGGGGGAVVISAVGGMAGIGKTALALHWAHQVAGRFPGGQLYVNLRGFDPADAPLAPGEAVRGFLDGLGVDPARIPVDAQAQASLYRSLLAGRRVLVVLDNARDAGQVRPLLPGTATCLVVVTSRSQLPGLVAAEGARPLQLGLLPADQARELLARHLGPDRAAAEPQAVAELIGLCAGLPLALSTVAARAAVQPGLPLAALAAELRDACGRLDALEAGDPATSFRAVLSWSVRHLDPAIAAMFRLLGTHPGPDVSAAAAASLAGLAPRHAREVLAALTRAHLLAEHVPGRFAMHDLVRAYAAEQASTVDSDTARRDALCRVLDHYLHTALAADMLLRPGRESPPLTPPPRPGTRAEDLAGYAQALAWFEAERPVLLAAIAEAAAAGLATHAWQISRALENFALIRGYWHDYARAQRTALSAAGQAGDVTGQAYAHRELALALLARGDGPLEEARTHALRALDLYAQLSDHTGQARAHRGLSRILDAQGRHREALRHDQQALDLFRAAGHDAGQGEALNAIGWSLAHLGEPQRAVGYCKQAISLLQAHGDRYYEAGAWDSLGYAHHLLSHHAEAIACYQRSIDLCRQIGDTHHEADQLLRLGEAHQAAGDPDAARRAWQQALAIIDDLHRPDAGQVRARLLNLPPADPPTAAQEPR
jgi:tetratricopeptide (TPR) repeat protein